MTRSRLPDVETLACAVAGEFAARWARSAARMQARADDAVDAPAPWLVDAFAGADLQRAAIRTMTVQPPAAAFARAAAEAFAGTARVVLVEEDPGLLGRLDDDLRRAGFHPRRAAGPAGAEPGEIVLVEAAFASVASQLAEQVEDGPALVRLAPLSARALPRMVLELLGDLSGADLLIRFPWEDFARAGKFSGPLADFPPHLRRVAEGCSAFFADDRHGWLLAWREAARAGGEEAALSAMVERLRGMLGSGGEERIARAARLEGAGGAAVHLLLATPHAEHALELNGAVVDGGAPLPAPSRRGKKSAPPAAPPPASAPQPPAPDPSASTAAAPSPSAPPAAAAPAAGAAPPSGVASSAGAASSADAGPLADAARPPESTRAADAGPPPASPASGPSSEAARTADAAPSREAASSSERGRASKSARAADDAAGTESAAPASAPASSSAAPFASPSPAARPPRRESPAPAPEPVADAPPSLLDLFGGDAAPFEVETPRGPDPRGVADDLYARHAGRRVPFRELLVELADAGLAPEHVRTALGSLKRDRRAAYRSLDAEGAEVEFIAEPAVPSPPPAPRPRKPRKSHPGLLGLFDEPEPEDDAPGSPPDTTVAPSDAPLTLADAIGFEDAGGLEEAGLEDAIALDEDGLDEPPSTAGPAPAKKRGRRKVE